MGKIEVNGIIKSVRPYEYMEARYFPGVKLSKGRIGRDFIGFCRPLLVYEVNGQTYETEPNTLYRGSYYREKVVPGAQVLLQVDENNPKKIKIKFK